jgi:hypothetical protein
MDRTACTDPQCLYKGVLYLLRNGLRHFHATAAIAEVYHSLRKRGMPHSISRLEFYDQELHHGTDDVLKFNAVGRTKQDTYIIPLTDEYSDLTDIAILSHYTSQWATPCLTFRDRSFTFNSSISPTRCNDFSVYYPDVCLQLNMFRTFSRPPSGAQWLQWQPLVLPACRGDSRAVFVVGPVCPTTKTARLLVIFWFSNVEIIRITMNFNKEGIFFANKCS